MADVPNTKEDWLACLDLPEWAGKIPAGKLAMVGSPVLYVDGGGRRMTREDYIARWGIDPEPAWQAIKERQRRLGKKGGQGPIEL